MKQTDRDALLRDMATRLEAASGYRYSTEYRFHPTRKWRLDLAFPEVRVALEVDGGAWIRGRHNRPIGQRKDNEKINQAQLLGWRVFRGDWAQVKSGELEALLSLALGLVGGSSILGAKERDCGPKERP